MKELGQRDHVPLVEFLGTLRALKVQ